MDELDRHEPEARMAVGEIEDWTIAPAALLESMPDAVVASDRDGRIIYVNRLAGELFGYAPGELVGRGVQTLWPERFREPYTRRMDRSFGVTGALRFTTEAWGRRRDGTEFVGEMSQGVVETSLGPLLLVIGRDITERRAAEARLRALAALGEQALGGADAGSLAGEAVDLMTALLPTLGAEVRAAGGGVLAATGEVVGSGLRVPIGTGDALHLAPARELSDEELGFVRAVANTLAAALERLRDNEQTRYDAVHDPLTGLANRILLGDRLRHAVARTTRSPSTAAVLFVDIDRFKQINDGHGHAAGDQVLAALARRLMGAVRPGDTVARFGGDEFVAVCEAIDEPAAMAVGARILAAVQRPLFIHGAQLGLSASIGVALGSSDPDALLADADAAAYRVKAQGGGRVERF
jgi:diguanylate cyclase (GGDEF)-like protein/PAS domain S-box-containing protein